MAYNRGYQQPSPWTSGAPPGQVMSGLMTAYPQPGPQNFTPGPATGYNLGAASGINWNMPNNVANGQLRMGQQAGWGQQQGVIGGNQRQNQRVSLHHSQFIYPPFVLLIIILSTIDTK